MPQIPSLSIDFAQESEVLQILARPPLLSSQNVRWNGIYVQHHHQPAWETPEYAYPWHMILVHYAESIMQTERLLDERRQREQIGNEHIVIVPANAHHQANWNQENRFTLLFLEPAHLAHIAHESIQVDRVELIPQFATLDPLVYQIGRSLKSELETNGLGSRLLVDSLTTALAIHLLRTYAVWQQRLRDYAGGLSRQKLQQAIDYIQAYLHQDLSDA